MGEFNSNDQGFPGGSDGKESTCNVGDLGLIPGLGGCPGEGKGDPLQYSGLENSMDCIVYGVTEATQQQQQQHATRRGFPGGSAGKNPPAMWETWVRTLGWENPLEKGKATHSSILAQRIAWTVQFMGL